MPQEESAEHTCTINATALLPESVSLQYSTNKEGLLQADSHDRIECRAACQVEREHKGVLDFTLDWY
jgi:hypothetical protein